MLYVARLEIVPKRDEHETFKLMRFGKLQHLLDKAIAVKLVVNDFDAGNRRAARRRQKGEGKLGVELCLLGKAAVDLLSKGVADEQRPAIACGSEPARP